MTQKFLIYLKAIRVWQWPKNLVVFTLPIGSGIMEFQILISSLWAFWTFTYFIINLSFK